MTATHDSTRDLWALLSIAIPVAILGLYSWRQRALPSARLFAAVCALWSLWLLAIAAELAASAPAAKVAWFTLQTLLQLVIVTVMVCFTLEYVYPGRWLTRRNVLMLGTLSLIFALFIATNGWHHLFWHSVTVVNRASVRLAAGGLLGVAYVICLALIQLAALIWLFAGAPQYRWPAALMIAGLLLTRGLFLLPYVRPSAMDPFQGTVAMALLPVVIYALALFGFRIFDPLPAARTAAIDQMYNGMVVFDAGGRVLSLNPAAAVMLGVDRGAARGKRWQELTPAGGALPALADAAAPEFTLNTGSGARQVAPSLSPLRDFRGLLMGYLLLLRDVTEQQRAQAQIVEQQRTLATLHEREHLARELHDSIGQVLGYASFQAQAAGQLIEAGQAPAAGAQLARLASVLQDAHADVRQQILDLRAMPGLHEPFFAAVQRYLDGFATNYNLQTQLTVGEGVGTQPLTPDAQAQVLRILQEALANARKHSGARCVQVDFAAADGTLRVSIADDGRGFDPAQAEEGRSHFGLHFMRERAGEVGGNLEVRSVSGAGTRVTLEVPLKEV